MHGTVKCQRVPTFPHACTIQCQRVPPQPLLGPQESSKKAACQCFSMDPRSHHYYYCNRATIAIHNKRPLMQRTSCTLETHCLCNRTGHTVCLGLVEKLRQCVLDHTLHGWAPACLALKSTRPQPLGSATTHAQGVRSAH